MTGSKTAKIFQTEDWYLSNRRVFLPNIHNFASLVEDTYFQGRSFTEVVQLFLLIAKEIR